MDALDLQALSVNPVCLEFGPNDSKVVLKPRLGYVPKVLSTPFRAQVLALSVFFPPTGSQESLFCSVGALRIFIEHSASYSKSEQLFVGFGNHTKGGPVTKPRIFRWLVDAITLAHSSSGLQCPIRVRAHSTRGIASSWAWSSGVSISDICEVAGWSSPSTFARFYNLDVPVLQASFAGPFCLDSNLFGFTWPTLFKPLFAWSVHNCMDARYHCRDDTQATGDPQGSLCAWCTLLTPLGLIPCESWFRVVPRHSTAWLNWFPYLQYEWNIERERTLLLS